jgi:predicted dienelactone hydrolase
MTRFLTLFFIIALHLLVSVDAYSQEVVSLSRQDQKPLSVTAYWPKSLSCLGVAIISPGAGGSEKGYQYLGETMSSIGYLSVVVGHQESGRRALREHVRGNRLRDGLAELITDPDAYRGRFMDIVASKLWAKSKCNAGVSILIGHSMGAATAMLEAGARNKLGVNGTNSFSAYIALSPQGSGSIFPNNAWADIKQPVLSITGTRDSELGGASWETRTEPYINMPAGCKWLGVIDGATHMNFAGNGISRKVEALTTRTIAAFLEGLERGDCKVLRNNHGIDIQTK